MAAENKEVAEDYSVPVRGFRIGLPGHPTSIQIQDFSNGHLGVYIETTRDGMEPLVTSMRLHPKTFRLLMEAMMRAAHDPDVWKEFRPHTNTL